MSTESVIISKPVSSLTSPLTTESKVKAITLISQVESTDKDATLNNTTNITKPLTEKEKLELRAKKFGAQLDSTKLENRAKRFSLETPSNNTTNGTDDDKLKKRAERFGASLDNNTLKTNDSNGGTISDDAVKKRALRFGNNNGGAAIPDDDKIAKRKERFGIADEESKKKQRSERFNKK